jgi:hypothetical protein
LRCKGQPIDRVLLKILRVVHACALRNDDDFSVAWLSINGAIPQK